MTKVTEFIGEISGGINMVDIGCSGTLNSKWAPIENAINFSGFDPNQEECSRLAALPMKFRSVTYHPYAVAGHDGPATLYLTKSKYCYSLLKPDTEWLRRFSFYELLELVGEEPVSVVKLSSIKEFQNVDLDILKIDAQGMELEILSGAGKLLDDAIYVETESGFTPNYIKESTQAQVDEYMRSKGFLLFDLILYRVPQNNAFKDANPTRAQLLWSESVWLRDYISLYKTNRLIPGKNINRVKALKSLVICAVQGCVDFGLELAKIFHALHLLSDAEFARLSDEREWKLEENGRARSTQSTVFNFLLRMLPKATRKWISHEAAVASSQKNIFKRG